MSDANRIALYFKALGEGIAVSPDDLAGLLWRGDPDGGPLKWRQALHRRIRIAEQLIAPTHRIERIGKTKDARGWRMERA